MSTYPQPIRRKYLLDGLPLSQPGLEVSPLFRPTALKGEHNVYYTDYTSAEESRKKHSGYEHDEIVDIDFIWVPGSNLIECIPDGRKFKWAIASHVLEHVPDPIGWILQVLEALEVGGVFSLALPDKNYCYDIFRRETETSDLIDLWLRQQAIPSPLQIYDFLSRSVDGSGDDGNRAFETAKSFEEATRSYSDNQALEFAINSWKNGTYFDIHCSVFTPKSFLSIFEKIIELGIINATISEPVLGQEEFYVKFTKVGDSLIKHPGNFKRTATLKKWILYWIRKIVSN